MLYQMIRYVQEVFFSSKLDMNWRVKGSTLSKFGVFSWEFWGKNEFFLKKCEYPYEKLNKKLGSNHNSSTLISQEKWIFIQICKGWRGQATLTLISQEKLMFIQIFKGSTKNLTQLWPLFLRKIQFFFKFSKGFKISFQWKEVWNILEELKNVKILTNKG